MNRHFPLHIHISSLFLLLIVIVGVLIGGMGYKLSRDMLETTAVHLVERISGDTISELQHIFTPAEMAVQLISHDSLASATSLESRLQRIEFLREALLGSTALSSVYVGYATGDFFLMRRILSDVDLSREPAAKGARYAVQSIEHGTGEPQGRYVYYDEQLKVIHEVSRPEYARSYDPRGRTWYKDALQTKGQIKTAPYVFFSNQKVGSTIATPVLGGQAVVGADILLETLSAKLAKQRFTPNAQLALVGSNGDVLAHQDGTTLLKKQDAANARPQLKQLGELGVPVLALLGKIKTQDLLGQRRLAVDGQDWRVTVAQIPLTGTLPLYLVMAAPDRELLGAAYEMRSTAALLTLIVVALAIPITWYVARIISQPLRLLAEDAEAIRRFEFSRPNQVSSMIKEVNELGTTMDSMKRTIRRFLDINRVVAAEEDFDLLLPRLLTETLSAAQARGGVLYLAKNDTMVAVSALTAEGRALLPTDAASLPSFNLNKSGKGLLGQSLADGTIHAGALTRAEIEVLGLDSATAAAGMHIGMAVPLINRHHEVVGALLLLGAESDAARISFIAALSGSAAITLETRSLIEAQKELFESFVQLIAGAIDAKSPYTGGHCARVPELTKMLARAACAQESGPFKDFNLGEQEWEAVHLGAWLHDCGKVTTPEYVVDKATKLETIYDRIHEIRTRFEVLKRDAEIVCLKAIIAGEDASTAKATLAQTLAQIDDDFAFIAQCNEGGEFMAPDKLARLQAIASQTWQRTLDNSLGIAHEEKARKAALPPVSLPATEPLIADRPEHLLARRPQDVLTDDNPWGIRMPSPKLMYNRGELYNLSVARGTLSEEERYKINEHIVQTQIMLSQLPFPKHLRAVPEIAGGHHEKMDGTGYPKRLTREQMSPVARMMAIADIFEALTAEDRPYKKGKTLSEAIKIMSFMRKDQHIDGELFELFLQSGVHLEYAAKFMRPQQVDEVDISKYLTSQVLSAAADNKT